MFWNNTKVKAPHLEAGELGERAAKQFLESKGYKTLKTNWSTRAGEIDLIMKQGKDVVFVEVKTRLSTPSASNNIFNNIDYRKKKKMLLLKDIYLSRYRAGSSLPAHRIDLIGVILEKNTLEPVEIKHVISGI